MRARAPRAPAPIDAPLPAVDACAPWMRAFARWTPLLAGADWRARLSRLAQARGVVSGRGLPVRFADADAAGETPYELHIARTGAVPTRANLHDAFNALAWLVWPRAKAALNARQAQALERDGVRPVRGPVRDAATLIDESGLLLASDDPSVFEALHQHDWHRLLVAGRPRWGREIVALPFGHALLEKLAGPFKGITACVVPVPAGGGEAADAAAAAFVARADLAPALLAHLPVLGIPGWCEANRDPRFYDDPCVFRPRRAAA
jgi:hypothetical protein